MSALRVGFIPGVEPDRFSRRWRQGPRPMRLELIQVPWSRQREALDAGEIDMCFMRLGGVPGAPSTADPAGDASLHVVRLWEERPMIVVGDENILSLHPEATEADLMGETEIPADHPDDARDRVATVAAGIGYTRLPMSLARLHHRKDAVVVPLADAEPTRIALVWPKVADDPVRQEFVGVVRGRTVRSSR